jgi:2-polyprenyl-6-methoxyphenol hydroxylase-like FAD-dependent oxidoreductase
MAAIDAVVIGGGLAGAAFALELARHGRDVVVLERTATPHLKVCGDFLGGNAQELLAYLGLDLKSMGATAITTLRLRIANRTTEAPLPFRAAGVSRLRLDQALLEEAQRVGARVIRGSTVTGLVADGSTVLVRTGTTAYHARTAALATGKYNLRGWQRDLGSLSAFKMPFSLSSTAQRALDGVVALAIYDGGYIGACLVEDQTATLCWLADRRLIGQFGGDWSAQLAHLAHRTEMFGDLLGGATPRVKKPAAVSAIPFGYLRRAVVADNVFPIGDQLAVIPSFTGDGTTLALSSAIAAAWAVMEGRPAAQFQSSFIAALGAQFRWGAVIDAGLKTKIACRFGSFVIARCPWVATTLVQLTRFEPKFWPARRDLASPPRANHA